MRHLFGIDRLQRGNHLCITRFGEQVDHARGDIQTPRLQHHRHHGQPAQQITGGILGGLPHEGMGGHGAVMATRRLQTVA